MASPKGKETLMEGIPLKRKKTGSNDEETGSRKRRNRSVLQFFEDAAYEVNGDSSSDDQDDFDINDFLEDELLNESEANNDPVKHPLVPFIKEEEMDDALLERMVEERYGQGSTFIRYVEDGYDIGETIDPDEHLPDFKEPTLWKVKCMVGREKLSVYCLMQKYVGLQTLGTNLQIISAFALDHVKGFIYVEAHSQQDLYEACKGLSTIYVSRVTTVPPNQRAHLLSVQSKGSAITSGMWVRVKGGKYKGDLAQIVAINEVRKKATVKLIPRIDLRVLAEKIGGGVPVKRTYTAIPPRIISSAELEEFRPLVRTRRDRDTNINYEVLDGMMLKDGYLYKKIAIDSLNVWGAMPTDDELLKFEPLNDNESMELEFLSDLYGNSNRKEKQIMKNCEGVEKGEGPSTSDMEYNFEVHGLVFFGKDFGVIIGLEKDNHFKIMKEGTEGPLVLTLPAKDLKSASFDKKLFTAKDGHMQKISVNDRVRVMDGLLKDKEGVVKHIFGGIIFLYNEREEEHNGYICFKSLICEKVISAGQATHEQGNEPGPSGLDKSPSSPKTPLPTDKAWLGRGNISFNKEDKNAMFSVGQSLRIRVGPLKGYLCRILAIRRSDITVKLDSQQKVLTVKSEYLSEVSGKSSASVTGGGRQKSAGRFNSLGKTDVSRGSSWGQQPKVHGRTEQQQSWGNQAGSSWNKSNSGSSGKGINGGSGLSKPTGGSSWGKQVNDRAEESHGTSDHNQSWISQGGSSWKKRDGGPTWCKPAGGSSWGLQAGGKAQYGSASGWEMKSKSFNKAQYSAWGNSSTWNQNSAGNSTDSDKRDQIDSGDVKKTSVGGSSTGWGKGNWGKSSTDAPPKNQNSSWSNKSDWGAGNDYSRIHDQVDNITHGGGRRGSWRGSQSGRGDSGRGGFGGRGGSWRGGRGGRGESDRGGFVGRGGSWRGGRGGRGESGSGGFRGRAGNFRGREGAERGGYGGRGRSDRGGFRGRGRSEQGDFRGRGRGKSGQYGSDWNNINDSGEQKTTSWSKSSWMSTENKGNWNQGGADTGQQKGWRSGSQPKGNIVGADGVAARSWGKSEGGWWQLS